MPTHYANIFAAIRGPHASYEASVAKTQQALREAGIPALARQQSQVRAQAQLPSVASLTEDERKVCKLMGTDPAAYAAQKQRDIESKSRFAPPVSRAPTRGMTAQARDAKRAEIVRVFPQRAAAEIDAIMATYDDGNDAA
jgi:hypothetical protein